MRFVQLQSVLALFLVVSTAAIGCNQSPSSDADNADSQPVSSSEPVNAYCPMMGGKVTKDGGTVEWDGKTVGFCCDGCDEKFMALSDDEKSEKLATAQAKSEGDTGHEDHQKGDHDHS